MTKRYAFLDLKPKKGKFISNVIGSTVALFIIVFLYTWVDYGKVLSLKQGLKLFGIVFLLALAIWTSVYFLKALLGRDKT